MRGKTSSSPSVACIIIIAMSSKVHSHALFTPTSLSSAQKD